MKSNEYILKLLKEKTKVKISMDTKISSLDIDSLDFVEMIVETEEKFGLSIPDSKLEELSDKTIKEIIQIFEDAK